MAQLLHRGRLVMHERSANTESERLRTRSETALEAVSGPPKIFIVEDDPDVSQVLADLLVHFGYVPCKARDGLQAMAMWHAGVRPDVVLLDLVMPNMDGYRFRRAQQSEPAFARVPVIVLTAASSPELESLDVQAYLKKPFDMDVLVAEIERVCEERRGARRSS